LDQTEVHERIYESFLNVDDTHATYERIYDVFGPQRLMWGTDFPHILRNIGYENGLALFRDHLPFLTKDDQEWLFSKTALSIWKFGEK
jgi:predicted TIM-barrel fold metal-dependent hydrolase